MEAEGGGITPFWAETNQDFRRNRRHNRRSIRIPDGVFAVFLSPLALIPTLVVAAVLVSYIPTLLSPLSQFLRRFLLFKSWEAFNLLLVLFAILTGIFSRNTNAGGHQPHHQESDPLAAKLFDFPGKSEDRNGQNEVGGSRIIFHRSNPLRNKETHPAAVQEEAPLSPDFKAAWFPDDGRKTETFGSQGDLTSVDAHFQRDAHFVECSLRSSSSSSAHSPPKPSNVDRGSLIQRRRSPTSFLPPPPLENIDAEDAFVVPRRRSPPPLPPLGTINIDGDSNIRRKHFSPPLLSHPPETSNADDGADVEMKHSRPPLVYHPLETMNFDDGCVIQRKHPSPPLKSLSPPPLPHSAYSHALEVEAPESKTKRRSRHRSQDAPSPPFALSSSRKKEKKKKKEKEKEKKKSRGTEPTAEIPVSPPLPPLPPSSFFHQWFADLKNGTKMEKLRPHSDRFLPPGPLPPPSSLPLHLGTTKEPSSSTERQENARKENVGSRNSSTPQPSLPPLIKGKQKLQIEVRSSSSDSSSGRSIPYLPPPPPPPFAVPEKSTVKQSNSVQTRRESTRVHESLTEQRRGEERSGNSLFFPSPDVNVKADKFIARFHEGIRLEKLQSAKEKLVREGVGAKR